RLMLILMIVLVVAMCMMSLATWFLYGTYVPEFEVTSLRVSNFTATNTTLRGTWNADVIVYNPNEELAVDFQGIRSLVFYRGVVVVSRRQRRTRRGWSMWGLANNNNDNLHGVVLPALARDWSNGAVVFSLSIALDAKLESPHQVYRQDSLRVSCDDLEVRFMSADVDEGRLSRGLGAPCLIRIRDRQVCITTYMHVHALTEPS
ncbi:hypothetical protein MIMGU_mgv1a022723mg, partial [Erythranthe guttata]